MVNQVIKTLNKVLSATCAGFKGLSPVFQFKNFKNPFNVDFEIN